jgi:hypothetical protein
MMQIAESMTKTESIWNEHSRRHGESLKCSVKRLLFEEFPAQLLELQESDLIPQFEESANVVILQDFKSFLDIFMSSCSSDRCQYLRCFNLPLGLCNALNRKLWQLLHGWSVGRLVSEAQIEVHCDLGKSSLSEDFLVYHPSWGTPLKARTYSTVDPIRLHQVAAQWVALGAHKYIVMAAFTKKIVGRSCLLVQECGAGSLEDWIVSGRVEADAGVMVRAALAIVRGLSYAHSVGCYHMHLSASCVLADDVREGEVCFKISDFGLHELQDSRRSGECRSVESGGDGTPSDSGPAGAPTVFAAALIILRMIARRDDESLSQTMDPAALRARIAEVFCDSRLPSRALQLLQPALTLCLCSPAPSRPTIDELKEAVEEAAVRLVTGAGPTRAELEGDALCPEKFFSLRLNTINAAVAAFEIGCLAECEALLDTALATLTDRPHADEFWNVLLLSWRLGRLQPQDVVDCLLNASAPIDSCKACGNGRWSPDVRDSRWSIAVLAGACFSGLYSRELMIELCSRVLREGAWEAREIGEHWRAAYECSARSALWSSRSDPLSVFTVSGMPSSVTYSIRPLTRLHGMPMSLLVCSEQRGGVGGDEKKEPCSVVVRLGEAVLCSLRCFSAVENGARVHSIDSAHVSVASVTFGRNLCWRRDKAIDGVLLLDHNSASLTEFDFVVGQFFTTPVDGTVFANKVIGIELFDSLIHSGSVSSGACCSVEEAASIPILFFMLLEGRKAWGGSADRPTDADDAKSDCGSPPELNETSPSAGSEMEAVDPSDTQFQPQLTRDYFVCTGHIDRRRRAVHITHILPVAGIAADQCPVAMRLLAPRNLIVVVGSGGLLGAFEVSSPAWPEQNAGIFVHLCNDLSLKYQMTVEEFFQSKRIFTLFHPLRLFGLCLSDVYT